ncbi:MAG: N-acetylmuramoyl-L-alanine amidase [Lachnospiraceae bacterium]|nr:N-acetylmuramoyl-L-alanine amidase [Lachnospiraceae bacterium]
MKNKIRSFAGLVFLLASLIILVPPVHAFADEPVVVVIDPGHGGENLGAEYEEYTEKEITLIVANAMYEELSKYDGVKVYMTRTGDQTISLADRAEYAASVNADVMIALHFNMSENHNLFGSEVWISAFGEKYQEGYALGKAFLEQFDEMGIYRRGIKTRLGDDGTDYYGIIREARARDVTSIIVEHCHLDQANDHEFYNSEEKLKKFGKMDAVATAKYFGLSSEKLGVDYSDYENAHVELPLSVVAPDLTPPDICYIELADTDTENRTVKVRLSAEDYDSYLLYYSYSVDGGQTFSDLREWPEGDTFAFTIAVPNGMSPNIVVNVYNKYDKITTSNALIVEGFPLVSRMEESEEPIPETQTGTEAVTNIMPESVQEAWKEKDTDKNADEKKGVDRSFSGFLKICGICIGILFLLLIIGYGYLGSKKKKRRRRF